MQINLFFALLVSFSLPSPGTLNTGMNETNNSSLNVVESSGFQADPSSGLKQGEVSSELVSVEPKMSQTVTNHQTNNGMNDVFHRDTLVYTGVVSTTDNITVMDSILPGSFWFLNAFIASRLKYSFAYFGSIIVTYQFNVPPGAFGTYVVSAIPQSLLPVGGVFTEIDGQTSDNVVTARQGLHAIVSMASSTSVQIILPWLSHKDYQLVSTENFTNWRLVLYCLAPLQLNSAAAGSAPYSVFVRGGPDFKLFVPNFQAGKLSEVASAVQGVASAVAQFPAAAPFAAPVAFVAGVASRVLSALGLTRHTVIQTPAHIKHMAGCSITYTDGEDNGDLIALTGANTLTLESFGGADTFDNMTFQHLFPRPTLIHQFQWSTADVVNTQYTAVGVTPFWYFPASPIILPVAGYVGLPFKYWRGTMYYELIISASALMRGTLQIFWCPDTVNPAAALDISNVLYNDICDIESNMTCRFSVGFVGIKPMLQNVCVSTAGGGNAFNREFCNGHLCFKVINPLTSMAGAASVTVSLFSWADDDMRFALPRDFMPGLAVTPNTDIPFPTAFSYQSGEMGKTLGSSVRAVENKVLVPHTPTFSIANALVGEEIFSIRPLLQKFSRVMYTRNPENGALLISSGMSNYLDHFGGARLFINGDGDTPSTVYPYSTGDYQCFNWFRHYAFLFDSMAGSTRYKVFTDATGYHINVGDGSHVPYRMPIMTTGEILAPTSGIAPLAEPPIGLLNDFSIIEPRGNTTSTEFTIPYYGQVYSQPCRILLTNNSPTNSFLNSRVGYRVDRLTYRDVSSDGVLTAGLNGVLAVNIFSAGGPDSKFNTFRRVPGISPRTADAFPTNVESWIN